MLVLEMRISSLDFLRNRQTSLRRRRIENLQGHAEDLQIPQEEIQQEARTNLVNQLWF